MNNPNNLIDGFLDNPFGESKEERAQLVRILSRSGTIPKIENLHIQYIKSKPDLFFVEPGKALRIGVNLIADPARFLVILRYGIEWQIWYNATKDHNFDPRICDLAASLAVHQFIRLLPESDKHVVSDLPTDLKTILDKLETQNGEINLSNQDYETLKAFHAIDAPLTSVDENRIKLVLELAIPTETMLMSGGDVRLNVDHQELLNVYGCRPFPRPEAFTFASSTATSVSNIGFDKTQYQREKFIANSVKSGLESTYQEEKSDLLGRLKKSLHLGEGSDVLLSPSGTDAALLFAGICQSLYADKNIVHILVASDETGSGVPLALQGRNFADNTALGFELKKEELIDGFREVGLINIPLRNEEGYLKKANSIDAEVVEAVNKTLAAGVQPVLHIMDQSKLGYSSPSEKCLNDLIAKNDDDLLVLVDNSQLRMDTERIQKYLNNGFVMTVTGSKFFTGPPFCGALIIPEKRKVEWQNSLDSLPTGLVKYFLKSELPVESKYANNLGNGINTGSYMRWYAALTEMERYFQIPFLLRQLGTDIFCDHVAGSIDRAPFLESLGSIFENDLELASMDKRTIFPFFINHKGRVLSHPEMDKIYRLLNKNIVSLIKSVTDNEERIAKQVCHIGQPVKVIYKDKTASAVVRISLGSRVLSESWKDRDVSIYFQRINGQLNQVDLIIKKIELILKHDYLFGPQPPKGA